MARLALQAPRGFLALPDPWARPDPLALTAFPVRPALLAFRVLQAPRVPRAPLGRLVLRARPVLTVVLARPARPVQTVRMELTVRLALSARPARSGRPARRVRPERMAWMGRPVRQVPMASTV